MTSYVLSGRYIIAGPFQAAAATLHLTAVSYRCLGEAEVKGVAREPWGRSGVKHKTCVEHRNHWKKTSELYVTKKNYYASKC